MFDRGAYFGSDTRYRVFNTVKYLVYSLLTVNAYLFLQEELGALDYTFGDNYTAGQVIQVFSGTIDTTAWVVLLWLFELETGILDDDKIKGWVKWLLHGTRGICSIFIVYAFTGYYAEMIALYKVVPLRVEDACALVGQGYSLLLDLDQYAPLDATNCASLGDTIYRQLGFNIIADADVLRASQRLAWTDLINSADWILVVIVLEVEVRLQLLGDLSDRIMGATKIVKYCTYSVLFMAAVYWGYAGEFLDFWDAALWLFAFVFIELNVFEWQYETSQETAAAATA